MKPFEGLGGIDNMKVGFIENQRQGVVLKTNENDVVHMCMFFLRDKHLYSSIDFIQIFSNVEKF